MTPSTDHRTDRPFVRRPFFMPYMDTSQAEYFYSRLRAGITTEALPERRLQRIDFVHDGIPYSACVGDEDFRGKGPVLAIYGPSDLGNLYFIVTRDAGLTNWDPFWVGETEVRRVEAFLED
jgi:hypothetical protein